MFWVSTNTSRNNLSFPVSQFPEETPKETPRVSLGNFHEGEGLHIVHSNQMTLHFPDVFLLTYMLPSLGMGLPPLWESSPHSHFWLFNSFSSDQSLGQMFSPPWSFLFCPTLRESLPLLNQEINLSLYILVIYVHFITIILAVGSMSERIPVPYTLRVYNKYFLSE